MEQNNDKPVDLSKLTRPELIAYVAEQIRGKILFPRQVEEAKRILDRARFVQPKTIR
jgi:hypothetical protein